MRIASHHAFAVAVAFAALSLFATDRAWAPAQPTKPEKITGSQPEWDIVLVNPDTGSLYFTCNKRPSEPLSQAWLNQNCRRTTSDAVEDPFTFQVDWGDGQRGSRLPQAGADDDEIEDIVIDAGGPDVGTSPEGE